MTVDRETTPRRTFVSAVVYARGDAEHLAAFLTELGEFLASQFELCELIVVDDASTDASAAIARDVANELALPITIIELSRRHGIEAAFTAGLHRAVGDFVFEIEGVIPDYPFTFLEELYEAAVVGHDVVSGSGGQTHWRSRLFYRVINRYGKLGVELDTETVRIVSRRALNAMLAMREKVRYRKALYALTGYPHRRLVYTPIRSRPRARKLDRETMGTAFDVIISFSDFGLRLAHWLAWIFAGISAAAGLFALISFLVREDVVPGWTTLMLLASASFAVVFFVLAVMGEYLQRILIETRARPLYTVRSEAVLLPSDPAPHPSIPRTIEAQEWPPDVPPAGQRDR